MPALRHSLRPGLFFFALALPFCPQAHAQSYTFTTFAGQAPQLGADDGAGTAARFRSPYSVAATSGGTVYVADTENHIIRKITASGVVTTIAGAAGQPGDTDGAGSNARFNSPRGIAVDAGENLYVADYENGTIRKISAAGTVTTLAGAPRMYGSADGPGNVARLNGPWGVTVDASGNVFVADLDNRTIRKITAGGVVSTIAGGTGVSGTADGPGASARFGAPTGIALDVSGNLYIADTLNSTIRKITQGGIVSTIAGTAGVAGDANGNGSAARFNNPAGVTVDASGNLYVSDALNDTIRKIATDGAVTVFAGTSGTRGSVNGTGTAARFFHPFGLSADAAGNIYVADRYNHTIRKITPGGVVSAFAGSGGNFGSADGVGGAARFNNPLDVALDRSGNLFVADSYNSAIRKITPTGVVTTYTGLSGSTSYVDSTLSEARFGYVGGIAVDVDNTVYVTDVAYNVVRAIIPSGVSTYAGSAGQRGSTDATANAARFFLPTGLAVDQSGNIYVADASNHTIRKITRQRVVTTVAGAAGQAGNADGSAANARFTAPDSVAVDTAGNIYVADTGNSTIRKISAAGTVTTIAGLAGSPGSTDGLGSAARFRNPKGLTVDAIGNIFVADTNNSTVRKITSQGAVTTIGGAAGISAAVDGTGGNARFANPTSLTVSPTGRIYLVDAGNNTVIEGVLDVSPIIVAQPQSLTASTGSNVILNVNATGGGLSYQWKRDNTAIAGATSFTYTLVNAQSASAGNYTVEVSNSAGSVTSATAAVTVSNTPDFGRISNLAIRAQAGTGAQTLIVGIAIGGSGTGGAKPVLIRGSGPALAAFGVTSTLEDPALTVFQGSTTLATNDNWGGDPQITAIGAQVGAFPFVTATSKDAALYKSDFLSNTYTVQITGGTGTGIALAEIYDATPSSNFSTTTPRLSNVSARTQVGTGGDILIAGFSIGGSTAKTVLVRAVGAGLEAFGVGGVLADAKLEITRQSSGETVAVNDNWAGTAMLNTGFASVGAFALTGTSRDAALLITLPPGGYTAQVSGVDNTTGVALVEVYEVP